MPSFGISSLSSRSQLFNNRHIQIQIQTKENSEKTITNFPDLGPLEIKVYARHFKIIAARRARVFHAFRRQ